MYYGYMRVSSTEQNDARQLDALIAAGVGKKRIFADKVSGKDFKREGYRMLLKSLRVGDTLYVSSIDRLGRNYTEILNQWKMLIYEKKINICVLDMPLLDTRDKKDLLGTFVAELVLQILSFVAENERNNIHARQEAGIAAAKARGVSFGRPPKAVPVGFDDMIDEWKKGKITFSELMNLSGMSRSTLYRRMRIK